LLGPGFKASIEVESGKVRGRIDKQLVAEAMAWIADSKENVMRIWLERSANR